MEPRYRNSICMSDQVGFRYDMNRYRKVHVKYVKDFHAGNAFEWKNKREWILFYRRIKIIRKVHYPNGISSPLIPNVADCIDLLKGKKSLLSCPIKLEFTKSYTNHNRILYSKYFKITQSYDELFLSLHGKIEKALPIIARQIEVFSKIRTFKIYLNSSSSLQTDLSAGIKKLLITLNYFKRLNTISFNLKDVQLSDSSLMELFQFDKLKRPIKNLQILTDRLLDIEDDFDMFPLPAKQTIENPERIWKGFSNISSLADTLTFLHLQPLLRDASDHEWLRYFFAPLSTLSNLQTLILEMPNLELSQYDVDELSSSIARLNNLKKIKVLIQFGMISQKTLDNFFASFEGLDLRIVDLNLHFSTVVDYSTFFKSIAKNQKLERVSFNKAYLANLYFDPVLCNFLFNCSNLKSVRLSALPLISGLLPTKEKYNYCFKKLFQSLSSLSCLESFSFENPKVSADNDNLKVITEVLPGLDSLQELVLNISWKEHEVDWEVGLKFWETIVQKGKLKKLVITALFKDAENILPFIRTKIDSMKSLQCIAAHFASEVAGPQCILQVMKRIKTCDVIKEVHLHFKVKFLVDDRISEKIQQVLRNYKFFKKCVVEFQSVGGNSESKSIFRGGQDLGYY